MLSLSINIKGVEKAYFSGFGRRHSRPVLSGVDFELKRGETFGVLGPSGSGKTTLARIITGHDEPSAGTVSCNGKSIHHMNRIESNQYHRKIQMLYQNPESSLNPRKTVERSLREICRLLKLPSDSCTNAVERIMETVGLSREMLRRFPGQLSGGQNQRIALARILLLEPDFIILDEPVSSLDSSARAQMLHLLKDLQQHKQMGYLLISHDRNVIKFMSHQAGFLYQGKLLPAARSESGEIMFPDKSVQAI